MMVRRRLMSLLVVPVCLVSSSAHAAPPPDYKGRPFTDEFHKAGPPAIPGIVQCALYDLGGEGVAYHDTTKENEGSDVLNRDPDHERAHGSHYVWHFRGKEGVDLLTFHYGSGNNWAFWVFEKVAPAAPAGK